MNTTATKAKLPKVLRQGDTNYYRAYLGREATESGGAIDNRLLFGSARYARVPTNDAPSGFLAGPIIGPSKDLPNGGIQLSAGAGIIPATPLKKDGYTVPLDVRDLPVRKRIIKRFLDFVTIRFMDGKLTAFPLDEEGVAYFEVTTGDLAETESTYLNALNGMWQQGSVEYIGDGADVANGTMLPVAHTHDTVHQKARRRKAKATDGPIGVALTTADLQTEDHGSFVNGVFLWTTRLWKVRFTPKESEVVLARQPVREGNAIYDRYFLCLVHNGVGRVIPYTAGDAERKYMRAIAAANSAPTTQLIAPADGVLEPELSPEGTAEPEVSVPASATTH